MRYAQPIRREPDEETIEELDAWLDALCRDAQRAVENCGLCSEVLPKHNPTCLHARTRRR